MYIIINQLKEHIRKSIPNMIEKRKEMDDFQATLKGTRFDLDYSIEAVVKLARSDATFDVSKNMFFRTSKLK